MMSPIGKERPFSLADGSPTSPAFLAPNAQWNLASLRVDIIAEGLMISLCIASDFHLFNSTLLHIGAAAFFAPIAHQELQSWPAIRRPSECVMDAKSK